MTITERHILNACNVTFPQRQGMRAEDIEPLEGDQHEMTAFLLVWEDHGQTYSVQLVFRRYRSPLSWHDLSDANRAVREFEVLRFLGHNRFLTPPAIATGLDDEGEYLLMGAVSGQGWGTLSEALREGVVHQQVNLLVQLHMLEIEALRYVPHVTLEGLLTRYQGWARESGDDDARAVMSEVTGLMTSVVEYPSALLNMTADVSDLLMDDTGRIIAWLDWENAMVGDPRWDIAWLVEQLRRVHQMPELADLALERYQVATGSSFDDLPAWAALLAAMRLVRCAWARQHQDQLAFPGLEQLLMSYDNYRAWVALALADAR